MSGSQASGKRAVPVMDQSDALLHLVLPIAILSLLIALILAFLVPEDFQIGIRQSTAILICGILIPWLLLKCQRLETVVSLFQQGKRFVLTERKGFAVTLFLFAGFIYTVVGLLSSRWQPVVHDEFSYLFGAETLALGRVWNKPPAFAEFYDALHVLHLDKWVTRYPPGHCLMLLPGVFFGMPSLTPIVLCAGTVTLTYLLVRACIGIPVAILAALLILQAPALFFVSSGFMSHSSFWFFLMFFYFSLFRSMQKNHCGWALLTGVMAGLLIVTRPFPAVAMGWPAAGWVLVRTFVRPGAERAFFSFQFPAVFFCMILPFVTFLGFYVSYNYEITGRWLYAPWQQYRDFYEPANTLGFSLGSDEPRPDPQSVHWRKLKKAEAMRQDKQRFTVAEALRRLWLIRTDGKKVQADPKRLVDCLFPATCFLGLTVLLFFVGYGRRWSAMDTVLVMSIVSHYVFYSFFHAARDVGYYALEVVPLVVYFLSAGAYGIGSLSKTLKHPLLACIPLPFMIAAVGNHLLVEGPRFVHQRRQQARCYLEFQEKLKQRNNPEQDALVFVRYRQDHPFDQCDWINNTPDLNANVLVVLDLGIKNQRLIDSYPLRRAYLYDEQTDELLEIIPSSSEE
ncbi:MAG: hypothetical protein VX435_13275 [Planctomycetota bacterium]|nr:hypothetical protein [Planctomycetota bacterium]